MASLTVREVLDLATTGDTTNDRNVYSAAWGQIFSDPASVPLGALCGGPITAAAIGEHVKAIALSGVPAATIYAMTAAEFVAAVTNQKPATTTIPVEHRSPVTSLKKAAKLLGRPNEDSGVKWLKQCIKDGTILAEKRSRQGYVFDKTQFPANSWPEATPAKSR